MVRAMTRDRGRGVVRAGLAALLLFAPAIEAQEDRVELLRAIASEPGGARLDELIGQGEQVFPDAAAVGSAAAGLVARTSTPGFHLRPLGGPGRGVFVAFVVPRLPPAPAGAPLLLTHYPLAVPALDEAMMRYRDGAFLEQGFVVAAVACDLSVLKPGQDPAWLRGPAPGALSGAIAAVRMATAIDPDRVLLHHIFISSAPELGGEAPPPLPPAEWTPLAGCVLTGLGGARAPELPDGQARSGMGHVLHVGTRISHSWQFLRLILKEAEPAGMLRWVADPSADDASHWRAVPALAEAAWALRRPAEARELARRVDPGDPRLGRVEILDPLPGPTRLSIRIDEEAVRIRCAEPIAPPPALRLCLATVEPIPVLWNDRPLGPALAGTGAKAGMHALRFALRTGRPCVAVAELRP
jgi:hypothetical protein